MSVVTFGARVGPTPAGLIGLADPAGLPGRDAFARESQRATAIRTRGLTKSYGGRTVVDGLDLDLPAGRVIGLLGPSGAGKTTTIRMLLGLVRPTSGSAEVLGEPIGTPWRYLPWVGAVVEGPAFTPGLSGADNLRVLAHAGDLPTSRIPAVLRRVGLADRGRHPVRSYSPGMKQRLGIAAALLPEPRLLLLDELTNGLDPAGIAQVGDLITSFRDEGITVLITSQVLAEIEQLADHLVLIRDGRLLCSGSVADLVDNRPTRLVIGSRHPAAVDVIAALATELGRPAVIDAGRVEAFLDVDVTDEQAAWYGAELNRRAQLAGVSLSRIELHRPTLVSAFCDLLGSTGDDVR